jgi:hypothetical protein
LKRIESQAFSSLRSVSLPKLVVSIENDAFAHCQHLLSVAFTDDSELAEVSSSAFSGCPYLVGLSLPAGACVIDNLASGAS